MRNSKGGSERNEDMDDNEGQEGWFDSGMRQFLEGRYSFGRDSFRSSMLLDGVMDGFQQPEGCEESERCVIYVRESRMRTAEGVGSEQREQESEKMGAEDVHDMQNKPGRFVVRFVHRRG